MTIIDIGATRIVLLIEEHAIKIPRFYRYSKFYGFVNSILSGWSANRIEYVYGNYILVKKGTPLDKECNEYSIVEHMPKCNINNSLGVTIPDMLDTREKDFNIYKLV